MSELDFDELDKAVNTLMGGVPKSEPSKTDDIKTLTIKSTVAEKTLPATPVEPGPNSPAPAATSSRPAAAASSSVAARRGGRFMDVVHPSSNMKPAANSVSMTSRQGVTIQPAAKPAETLVAEVGETQTKTDTTAAITPPPAAPEKVTSLVTVADNAVDGSTAGKETTKNEWPDPLEMSGYNAEPATSSAPQEQTVSASTSNNEQVITGGEIESANNRPLESPFLSDTKVEKRPLGGAIVSESKETPVEEPNHAPVLGVLADTTTDESDANAQLPAKPSEVEPQLPPELHSDLMAIETDGDTAPAAETKEVAPVQSDRQADEKAVSAVAVTAPAVADKLTGPTSISQQYKESPTTSDQTSGSIYDTDSYHQPLTHPAKNKSGWLWVLWIVLLLLIGGGSAMALYFLDVI